MVNFRRLSSPSHTHALRSPRRFLETIRTFVVLSRIRTRLFLVSVMLLGLSSFFEGASLSLLIPLLKLLVESGHSLSSPGVLPFPFLSEFFSGMRVKYAFFVILGTILVSITVKHLFIYLSQLIVSKVSREAEHTLRVRIFDRYLSFSKAFFDNHKIGYLSNLSIGQVIHACSAFLHLHQLVLLSFMLAVYVLIMVFISWRLTLAALLFIPLSYSIVKFISTRIEASSREKFLIDQEVNATVYDSLSNMSLIRSYSTEETESARFRFLSDRSRQNLHSIWKKILFAPNIQEVVLAYAIGILLAVCSYIYLRGGQALGLASFITFFVFLRRFYHFKFGGERLRGVVQDFRSDLPDQLSF